MRVVLVLLLAGCSPGACASRPSAPPQSASQIAAPPPSQSPLAAQTSDDEAEDALSNPELAHPRARELMSEPFFWDIGDDSAPFGSDEGWEAYQEFHDWRADNPRAPVTACLRWIQATLLETYTEEILEEAQIERELTRDERTRRYAEYDAFTLDATIIATVLGQLIDEGRIDEQVKPYARLAVRRQLHPKMLFDEQRKTILLAVLRVIDAG